MGDLWFPISRELLESSSPGINMDQSGCLQEELKATLAEHFGTL